MYRHMIAGLSLFLTPGLIGCSVITSPLPQETITSLTTQIPSSPLPKNILTLTPSATFLNTPTPLVLNVDVIKWAFVPYMDDNYLAVLLKNNSDFGIASTNGGKITIFFEYNGENKSYDYEQDFLPPLAAKSETGFFFKASAPPKGSSIIRITVTYPMSGIKLADEDHEIPVWKTEIMKDRTEDIYHTFSISLLTVENTSHYPCLLEEVVAFAYDSKQNIIGIGATRQFHREEMDIPIPPDKKMGYSTWITKTAFENAEQIRAYPIAKGYGFCENPDKSAHPYESNWYPLPEQLEVVNVGGWGSSYSYSDTWYFAFVVRNTHAYTWVKGLSYQANVYNKNGELIGFTHDQYYMGVPPSGIGANWNRVDHSYSNTRWQNSNYVEVFAYSLEDLANENKSPEVENIKTFISEGLINVSCTLFNPEKKVIKHIYGAAAILYDLNGKIIGAGSKDLSQTYSDFSPFSLEPGEGKDIIIITYTSIQPNRIEVFPFIKL